MRVLLLLCCVVCCCCDGVLLCVLVCWCFVFCLWWRFVVFGGVAVVGVLCWWLRCYVVCGCVYCFCFGGGAVIDVVAIAVLVCVLLDFVFLFVVLLCCFFVSISRVGVCFVAVCVVLLL